MKTHYEVLGVGQGASPDEIRSAYKAQIRRFHPDVYEGPAQEATERTIELNGAYAVLSDPERRAIYDRMLQPTLLVQNIAMDPPDAIDEVNAVEGVDGLEKAEVAEVMDAVVPPPPEPRKVRPPPPFRSAVRAASRVFPDDHREWTASGSFSWDRYGAGWVISREEGEDDEASEELSQTEAQIAAGFLGVAAAGLTACLFAIFDVEKARSPASGIGMALVCLEIAVAVAASRLPGSTAVVSRTFAIEVLLVAASLILIVLWAA